MTENFLKLDFEPRKAFLITDSHFSHRNMCIYENRPTNFDDLIIQNWQNLVTDEDIIFHLGDVIFGSGTLLKEIMSELPGYKVLTLGNHDRNKANWYTEHGFNQAFKKYFIWQNIIFSHKPFNIKEIEIENKIKFRQIDYNIHGHFHSKLRTETQGEIEGRRKDDYPYYDLRRHLRLSIEEENYKPVLLSEFLKRQKK